jgi:hypothetical protein
LSSHDKIMINVEDCHDLGQILGRDVTASDQWRCGEGEPSFVAADSYEPCSALLD